MRLRIGSDALAEAVAWVARALPARPVIPILAGLMLEANEDDGLALSCFDYDLSARVAADAAVAESGRALVSGRLLAEIARSLPPKPVDLVADGDMVVLTCGSARFTLLGLPVEDFPALPSLPSPAGLVDGGRFATAVGQVAVAASRDDTLPLLNGVLIEIDGSGMTLVATDRYRMAVRELDWRPVQPNITASALVPARTLADATRTMTAGTEVAISLEVEGDEVAASAGGVPAGVAASAGARGASGAAGSGAAGSGAAGSGAAGSGAAGSAMDGSALSGGAAAGAGGLIGFDGGGRRLTTRLLGTEFVGYKSRFPTEFNSRADLAAGPFSEAIRRVALVADRGSRLLLTFGAGELVLETGSGDGSHAVETIEAEFEGEGGFAIAFKPQYLIDGIGAASAGTGRRAAAGGDREGRESGTGCDGRTDHEADAGGHTGAKHSADLRAANAEGAVATGSGPTQREGRVTLEFTTADKPAVITGVPGFRYLLAPMRG